CSHLHPHSLPHDALPISSSPNTKRPRAPSWRIPLSSIVFPVRMSAIIALALVVAALGADAALRGLQPALGGVQLRRLCRGLLGLIAAVCGHVVASVKLLPRLQLPVVLEIGRAHV